VIRWSLLRRRYAEAQRSGAIHPIPTACEWVEQDGARFVVRVAASLERKAQAPSGPPRNPFLPYEPELFVADLSATHVGLLNKFNVLDHHLLIVTRAFEDQQSPLTLPDFEALRACLVAIDGLGFYNAGRAAGASQPHKHLQLVPLPLAPQGAAVPIEPLLELPAVAGEPGLSRRLPFVHAAARVEATGSPEALLDSYRRLLRAGGCSFDEPYNLLVTRSWMLVVPRRRERYESVSINALGFAGALFVPDATRLRLVRDRGPLRVLASVGVECPG
jgi:ATP adenylyltransferase